MTRAAFGAILPAAGTGKRFGARKQFLDLAGRPMLHFSLDCLTSLEGVVEIVVACPPDGVETTLRLADEWRARSGAADRLRLGVVEGGARRQDSVRRGLEALGPQVRWVLVHDAARPLVRREDVAELMEAVCACGAAVLGHPVTDSVKEEAGGVIRRGLDRDHIWQVQTPQAAARHLLERAYRELPAESAFTDEVSLLEGIGIHPRLVLGSRDNIKVTLPGDLELAEFLLRRRA
ncbi:MAG: 2-C-methyl-D-erythritol 4-phosphate cytidylyltransferase [Planctomycetes bacterium]|nr:2-C-methyl-D-erythritol 4-phosphate cytidylyltransferase [Planctomycetota bacterium]